MRTVDASGLRLRHHSHHLGGSRRLRRCCLFPWSEAAVTTCRPETRERRLLAAARIEPTAVAANEAKGERLLLLARAFRHPRDVHISALLHEPSHSYFLNEGKRVALSVSGYVEPSPPRPPSPPPHPPPKPPKNPPGPAPAPKPKFYRTSPRANDKQVAGSAHFNRSSTNNKRETTRGRAGTPTGRRGEALGAHTQRHATQGQRPSCRGGAGTSAQRSCALRRRGAGPAHRTAVAERRSERAHRAMLLRANAPAVGEAEGPQPSAAARSVDAVQGRRTGRPSRRGSRSAHPAPCCSGPTPQLQGKCRDLSPAQEFCELLQKFGARSAHPAPCCSGPTSFP